MINLYKMTTENSKPYKKFCKICQTDFTITSDDIQMSASGVPYIQCPKKHGSFISRDLAEMIRNGEDLNEYNDIDLFRRGNKEETEEDNNDVIKSSKKSNMANADSDKTDTINEDQNKNVSSKRSARGKIIVNEVDDNSIEFLCLSCNRKFRMTSENSHSIIIKKNNSYSIRCPYCFASASCSDFKKLPDIKEKIEDIFYGNSGAQESDSQEYTININRKTPLTDKHEVSLEEDKEEYSYEDEEVYNEDNIDEEGNNMTIDDDMNDEEENTAADSGAALVRCPECKESFYIDQNNKNDLILLSDKGRRGFIVRCPKCNKTSPISVIERSTTNAKKKLDQIFPEEERNKIINQIVQGENMPTNQTEKTKPSESVIADDIIDIVAPVSSDEDEPDIYISGKKYPPSEFVMIFGYPALNQLKRDKLYRLLTKAVSDKRKSTVVDACVSSFDRMSDKEKSDGNAIKRLINQFFGLNSGYVDYIVSEILNLDVKYGRLVNSSASNNYVGFTTMTASQPQSDQMGYPNMMSQGGYGYAQKPPMMAGAPMMGSPIDVQQLIDKKLEEIKRKEEEERQKRDHEEYLERKIDQLQNLILSVRDSSTRMPPDQTTGLDSIAKLLDVLLPHIKNNNNGSDKMLDFAVKVLSDQKNDKTSDISNKLIDIAIQNLTSSKTGIPPGVPPGVWVDLMKINHEKDLKTAEIMEKRKEREERNMFMEKMITNLLPVVLSRYKNLPGNEQSNLANTLSKLLTSEEQEQVFSAIVNHLSGGGGGAAPSSSSNLQAPAYYQQNQPQSFQSVQSAHPYMTASPTPAVISNNNAINRDVSQTFETVECPTCHEKCRYQSGSGPIMECPNCGDTFVTNFKCQRCGTPILYSTRLDRFGCPSCGAEYSLK